MQEPRRFRLERAGARTRIAIRLPSDATAALMIMGVAGPLEGCEAQNRSRRITPDQQQDRAIEERREIPRVVAERSAAVAAGRRSRRRYSEISVMASVRTCPGQRAGHAVARKPPTTSTASTTQVIDPTSSSWRAGHGWVETWSDEHTSRLPDDDRRRHPAVCERLT